MWLVVNYKFLCSGPHEKLLTVPKASFCEHALTCMRRNSIKTMLDHTVLLLTLVLLISRSQNLICLARIVWLKRIDYCWKYAISNNWMATCNILLNDLQSFLKLLEIYCNPHYLHVFYILKHVFYGLYKAKNWCMLIVNIRINIYIFPFSIFISLLDHVDRGVRPFDLFYILMSR